MIVVRVLREGSNRPDKPVYYQVAVANQPDSTSQHSFVRHISFGTLLTHLFLFSRYQQFHNMVQCFVIHLFIHTVLNFEIGFLKKVLHFSFVTFSEVHKHSFCFVVVVNGELAAYKSKLFIQQLRTTYKTMLNEMVEKLGVSKPEEQKKPKKGGLLPIFRKK